MIDKRQLIKEYLKDCDPDQLHDGSYVTIRECVEMMEVLEQRIVKNLHISDVVGRSEQLVCDCKLPTSEFELNTGEVLCSKCEKRKAN